jgi:hypothetical protein
VEAAEDFGKQAGEPYTVHVQQASVVSGAPETVRKKLEAIDVGEINWKFRAGPHEQMGVSLRKVPYLSNSSMRRIHP